MASANTPTDAFDADDVLLELPLAALPVAEPVAEPEAFVVPEPVAEPVPEAVVDAPPVALVEPEPPVAVAEPPPALEFMQLVSPAGLGWTVTAAEKAGAPVESLTAKPIDVPAAMFTVQVYWLAPVS